MRLSALVLTVGILFGGICAFGEDLQSSDLVSSSPANSIENSGEGSLDRLTEKPADKPTEPSAEKTLESSSEGPTQNSILENKIKSDLPLEPAVPEVEPQAAVVAPGTTLPKASVIEMPVIVPIKPENLKVGDPAPLFTAPNHDGKDFRLEDRRGLWTVLYFYQRVGTIACTKQAKAYQEKLKKIRIQGADVFGVSMNTVAEQAQFRKELGLRFTLLADPEAHVVDLYGARLIPSHTAKRWTFIIDPHLKIRSIEKEVDPVQDAEMVALKIVELKSKKN